MQKRLASAKVPSVIWYIPTALDAGRYTSKGLGLNDQRQYVRTTGLPEPSTCASAASNSGDMMRVEYFRNRGAYCRHVSEGILLSVLLTGKKSSDGLRMTWNIQLNANHSSTAVARTINACAGVGASRNARHALRLRRTLGQSLAMVEKRHDSR